MARYVPDKGDIVLLDFDPSAGKEIIKRRPALVISRRAFNDHTGFSIVAPITSTVRGMALEIPLQGTAISGVVLMYQLRSLDVASRNISFVEKAPASIINKATEIAVTVIR
jgi:mRNA-degrading endonuclease toxin of MazEF toxin-antitoxin module